MGAWSGPVDSNLACCGRVLPPVFLESCAAGRSCGCGCDWERHSASVASGTPIWTCRHSVEGCSPRSRGLGIRRCVGGGHRGRQRPSHVEQSVVRLWGGAVSSVGIFCAPCCRQGEAGCWGGQRAAAEWPLRSVGSWWKDQDGPGLIGERCHASSQGIVCIIELCAAPCLSQLKVLLPLMPDR